MALLLIPEAVNKILERGRREGREQGLEEGRAEALQAEKERIRQLLQDSGVPLTPEQAKALFGEP